MSNLTETTGKILVQSNFVPTTAASIYTVPTGATTEITQIIVCNSNAASKQFYIFIDADGTTYDETTALFWQEALAADTARVISGLSIWLSQGTNLAVNVETTLTMTFTFFGIEHRRGIKPTFLQGPPQGGGGQ